jgi:MFS family permease
VASLIGGLAPNPPVLIVARVLQGAAAALMTPQVLSIIQLQYEGERRARAIGAYSMILAVGVAAGQLVGGLIMSAHVLAAAWRPALLINAPLGAALLVSARRWLPRMAGGDGRRLDLGGVALLSAALLTLVVPLTFGRQDHWPAWIWPSLAVAALAGSAFVALERRLRARGPTSDRSSPAESPRRRDGHARRAADHGLLLGFPDQPDARSPGRARVLAAARRCDLRDLRQRIRDREPHLDTCRCAPSRPAAI